MQQAIDILKSMKATREDFLKPYNENSIEYIKTKESIMTIDEMIFKLQALPYNNSQAVEVLDEMINEPEKINGVFNPKYISQKNTLREAKSRIQALGDGGGLFITPGKTYYIGDNKTPAVALFPRFQYSNGTIDTIHHTNIREAPILHKQ